ncbi:MAG: DUF3137 domain-containing protein [Capsulimonadaceae bacterium]
MGLFSASKAEIWQQLSAEIGARFETADGRSKTERVQAHHGQWIVTLDTVHHENKVFTRIRAPYINSTGFRFTISRSNILSGIEVALGMQDIRIGDAAFDDAFVIQANDEVGLLEFLADKRLRELIADQPAIELSIRPDEGWFGPHFPDGVEELHFIAPGVIDDIPRLRELFDLFSETLDTLTAIGAAEPEEPGIRL